MLELKKEEFIYNDRVPQNIYRVIGDADVAKYGEGFLVADFWSEERYRVQALHYYPMDKKESSKWMQWQLEAIFEGIFLGGPFIWPSDFLYNEGKTGEKDSVVLFFCEKQYDSLGRWDMKTKTQRENLIILKKIALALRDLHHGKMTLNGIHPSQVWIQDEEVKVQVGPNCSRERKQRLKYISEDARGVYREKIYGIPEYCCWEQLPSLLHNNFLYGVCNDIYAIATLFFEILFGIHPLDGELCDGQQDEDGKAEIYNRYPCFIFDEKRKRNQVIGLDFEEKERLIQSWNQTEISLKNLFYELYEFPNINSGKIVEEATKRKCFQLDAWIEQIENHL